MPFQPLVFVGKGALTVEQRLTDRDMDRYAACKPAGIFIAQGGLGQQVIGKIGGSQCIG